MSSFKNKLTYKYKFMVNGNLLKRIKLYSKRLLDDIYNYPYVFEKDDDWPGDYPGRTLLALTSLYVCFENNEKEKVDIKERIDLLFSHLKEYINDDYFFGPKFDASLINEQQLSGNSWYLRGICRYFEITHDQEIYEMLKTINEKLLIPLAKYYETYPIYERKENGGVSGHIIKEKGGNWILSSDVGCAFILLDGYVSTYEIIKDEKLKESIKHIINVFEKIDVVNLMCQTHATLTATRAILKFYLLTKEEYYLKLAIKLFDIYQSEGMSDDYQNINWFRKDNGFTWTEPCCVIDSFILSKHLYLITKNIKYLKLFNRIYVNGLRTFQRDNGGAGCTTISKNGVGEMKVSMYEAYFCCTLREGEGFYELNNSFIKNNNTYLFLIDEGIEDDNLIAHIDLYDKNIIEFIFKNDAEILLYIPDGFKTKYDIKNNFIKIKGHKDETISIDFDFDIVKDGIRNLYGDMLLTRKPNHIGCVFTINKEKYSLIYDSSSFDETKLNTLVQKV